MKVTVLGAGSFGTAMAVISARRGHQITMFMRNEEQAQGINKNHRNSKRFPDVELPENIKATSNLEQGFSLFFLSHIFILFHPSFFLCVFSFFFFAKAQHFPYGYGNAVFHKKNHAHHK